MTKEQLLGRICLADAINECCSEGVNSDTSCEKCELELSILLDKFAKQIRAEMYAEIKELAEKRGTEKCKYSSCDDCECCCEVQALEWLLEQLKEQK